MKQMRTRPNAVAKIYGSDKFPSLRGNVLFYQKRNYVLVEADIQGLPSNDTGFYGFHIHEGGQCTGTDFSDSSSHYNPENRPHPLHSGDLPPLISSNGNAYMAVATSRFCTRDIIGRTVVVHNMADDLNSQPSGNAGTKIACGVIRRV